MLNFGSYNNVANLKYESLSDNKRALAIAHLTTKVNVSKLLRFALLKALLILPMLHSSNFEQDCF